MDFEAIDLPEVNKNKRNIFLEKLMYKKRQIRRLLNRRKIDEAIQNLSPDIYKQLDFFLTKTDKAAEDYAGRLYEIIMTLDKVKPSYILEMGSGRSSVAFAAWSKRYGCKYEAFEQLEFWGDISNQAIQPFDQSGKVIIVPIKKVKDVGGRYQQDVPNDVDFLYVDGPTIKAEQGNKTFTGKSAYTDAVDFLRRGGRPKVIMIEGRTDTVDLIIAESNKLGLEYDLLPGFEWAAQRNYYREALACRRHSYLFFR